MLTRVYNAGASKVTLTGLAAGLLSGLSYAVFIFGIKYASPHGSSQAILAVSFAVLVIVLLLPSNAEQLAIALVTPSWPLFLALGVFGAGLSFIPYIIGLKHTSPAVASIVAMVEPVTAALFGAVVLDEGLVGSQIVGMTIIIITVTALSTHSSARQVASELSTN